LARRIEQHQEGAVPSFTQKYAVHMLVYYETHQTLDDARIRERNLKAWRRAWKLRLIEEVNPDWVDLSKEYLI
jgi:putative endonuclease